MRSSILVLFLSQVLYCTAYVRLYAPKSVLVGDPLYIHCSYFTYGDSPYAVNIYKNHKLFYTYKPDSGRRMMHSIQGVKLDYSRSRRGSVFVRNTTLDSEGVYRCEVLHRGPSYQVDQDSKKVAITVLPTTKPVLTMNAKKRVWLGDQISMNCSTSPSKPAATVMWFINGKPVHHSNSYTHRRVMRRHSNGLKSHSSGIVFVMKPEHLNDEGMMTVSCEGRVDRVIFASKTITISKTGPPESRTKRHYRSYRRF